MAPDIRYDFGMSLRGKTCVVCQKWILNRGCRSCKARLCREHFLAHSGAVAFCTSSVLSVESLTETSLDRIRRRSSNASTASARYHQYCLHQDYEVLTDQVLGEGLSGKVVVARSRANGRKFALKQISKSELPPARLQMVLSEAETFLTLDHPNVAHLSDVYETHQEIAILTQCLEGGELFERLAASKTFPEHQAVETTRQMLRAVCYLHSHNVVHRDLKPENFLYEDASENACLKLIDFGFAKRWDPSEPMITCCGSFPYVSPDVLRKQGYSNKCDTWSLGVIVYMLLTGHPPFQSSDNLARSILAVEINWGHTNRWGVTHAAIDFVKGLLVGDPDKRLDAQAAMNHPWLASIPPRMSKPVLPAAALRSIGSYAVASPLRRAVLQLVSRDLAPADVADLRNIFLQIANDEEGTICFSMFKSAVRDDEPQFQDDTDLATLARRCRGAKIEQLEEWFHMMDANGDEQVYYSDFLAASMDHKVKDEHLWNAFCRLDADNSGEISVEDLQKVIGDTFEGVDVRQLLTDVEVETTSNATGEIGFDSFRRALTARSL